MSDDISLTQSDYTAIIEALHTATAQSRGYRDADRCISYVGDVNPAWHAEATAFRAWRSATWEAAYAIAASVAAGHRTQPDIPAFLGELPVMVWPP